MQRRADHPPLLVGPSTSAPEPQDHRQYTNRQYDRPPSVVLLFLCSCVRAPGSRRHACCARITPNLSTTTTSTLSVVFQKGVQLTSYARCRLTDIQRDNVDIIRRTRRKEGRTGRVGTRRENKNVAGCVADVNNSMQLASPSDTVKSTERRHRWLAQRGRKDDGMCGARQRDSTVMQRYTMALMDLVMRRQCIYCGAICLLLSTDRRLRIAIV